MTALNFESVNNSGKLIAVKGEIGERLTVLIKSIIEFAEILLKSCEFWGGRILSFYEPIQATHSYYSPKVAALAYIYLRR